jgi:UbiD family decarboxylase
VNVQQAAAFESATACRSLRDWIARLEAAGELYRNRTPMGLRNDISYVSKTIADRGGPAVLHERVIDYPGWQVFHDGLTTQRRQALALGRSTQDYADFLFEVLGADRRVEPVIVDTGPCKERIIDGNIDLTALPLPNTSADENPPYITAGISHVITPDGGWQNIAIRRFQLQDLAQLSVLAMTSAQHEGQIIKQWFDAGERAPVVIVVGADPLYYICAQMSAPDGVAEFEYWGALAGEQLRMVRAETCPQILVPAEAEIVIEGHYHPTDRILEGPFSEFSGFHSGLFYLPKLEVETITMRRQSIYQYMYMGREPTEGHNIDHLVYSASMYNQIKALVPEVSDVAVLGSEGLTTAISIRKSANRPGLVRQLSMAARGCRAGKLIKNLIVVDDDIDVRNLNELVWALSVRFQGAKDLFVVDNLPGCYLDPSEPSLTGAPGIMSFTVFDLTEPLAPHDHAYKRGRAEPHRTDTATTVLRAMGVAP